MALSRKHFKAVADIMKHADVLATLEGWSAEQVVSRIRSDLSCYFSEENPNFNSTKFYEACKA
jgi:hypothetical protein